MDGYKHCHCGYPSNGGLWQSHPGFIYSEVVPCCAESSLVSWLKSLIVEREAHGTRCITMTSALDVVWWLLLPHHDTDAGSTKCSTSDNADIPVSPGKRDVSAICGLWWCFIPEMMAAGTIKSGSVRMNWRRYWSKNVFSIFTVGWTGHTVERCRPDSGLEMTWYIVALQPWWLAAIQI